MTLNSAASLLFDWFGTHLEVEHKPSPLVESFVGADDQLEVEQIVRVGKFRGTGFRQIQLVNICFQFLEIDREKSGTRIHPHRWCAIVCVFTFSDSQLGRGEGLLLGSSGLWRRFAVLLLLLQREKFNHFGLLVRCGC